MKVYNTLTRQKEEFSPIEEGKVRMYVCGPTVYNYIHIGNARSIVAFDVIRRYLEYRGFEVEYVSNFTDVDDKIIRASVELGISVEEVANRFIKAFNEDTEKLNVKKADHSPRVSDYIPKIVEFIDVLVKRGWAYESNGDVYFRSQKFPSYGKLSNQTIKELEAGASGRVGQEQERKEDVIDFALWKRAKGDEPFWESPWGRGRPGWHIECSVMALDILGETIDIHGGGQDLKFPHHTNEIAQSEAKTGKRFVNYWLHNGFVTIGEKNDKMSKSLGNFITVHELLKDEDSKVVRLLMASAHYRRPIRFSKISLEEAKVNIEKLKNVYDNFIFRKDDVVDFLEEDGRDLKRLSEFEETFVAEMDDDFNIANGMTVFYDLVKWMNMYAQQRLISKKVFDVALDLFRTWLGILGIEFQEGIPLAEAVERLLLERKKARLSKNFARADEIRKELIARGIILEDTALGTRWRKMER